MSDENIIYFVAGKKEEWHTVQKWVRYLQRFPFQADFRLVEKIGLLVPLEAVQACCYVEKKSQKPPKDLKSEMVDSG